MSRLKIERFTAPFSNEAPGFEAEQPSELATIAVNASVR